MTRTIIILLTGIFSILSLQQSFAQLQAELKYDKYNWQTVRQPYAVHDSLLEAPAVILKSFIAHEYYYDLYDQELMQLSVTHKIIKVNTTEGIENFNRIVIPVGENEILDNLSARSVSATGEIRKIENSEIKELKDEQEESGYRIFAVEGLEVGSEVEYFYVQRQEASYFGREYFQFKIPALNCDFELISPTNLQFSFKSYNNFPLVEEDFNEERRIYRVENQFIDALRSEPYAYYNPNRARLDFKLSYNAISGGERLLTFADASKRIHETIFVLSPPELESIQSFYDEFLFKKKDKSLEKIKAIENKIKTEFLVRNLPSGEFSDLTKIINNKVGNFNGMMKLYASLLKISGIRFQLVVTTKRDNARFDPEFDSWNNLVHYIIYFPVLDQYLAPTEQEYRLGMVPFLYTNNYGLFIDEVTIGDDLTGTGEVKWIPPLSYEASKDYFEATITLAEGMNVANVDIERRISGYNAIYIQPYYSFLAKDHQQEVIENYIKFTAADAEITSLEVENGEWNLSPLQDPLIIKSTMNSSNLIEQAGDKLLFKLGAVIGPQTELYQEQERQLGVENDYNRSYERKITFSIPEGYNIKNPEDIKINVFHEKDGERVFEFLSTYSLKKKELIVNIIENYKIIECPLECYEPFRSVINAAADFNKVTLVLEPKS